MLEFHVCIFSMAINFTWVYIFLCAYLLVYSRVKMFCMLVFLCVSKKYSDIKIDGQKIRFKQILNLNLKI